jgi:hypothetical protein
MGVDDLLKRLGINVDFAATHWGTVARRTQAARPGRMAHVPLVGRRPRLGQPGLPAPVPLSQADDVEHTYPYRAREMRVRKG